MLYKPVSLLCDLVKIIDWQLDPGIDPLILCQMLLHPPRVTKSLGVLPDVADVLELGPGEGRVYDRLWDPALEVRVQQPEEPALAGLTLDRNQGPAGGAVFAPEINRKHQF